MSRVTEGLHHGYSLITHPGTFGGNRLLCYTLSIPGRDWVLKRSALLDILRCPACVGQPAADHGQPTADHARPAADPGQFDLVSESWLVCRDCGRKYPIRDSIPVMLISEGDKYRHTPVSELTRDQPTVQG